MVNEEQKRLRSSNGMFAKARNRSMPVAGWSNPVIKLLGKLIWKIQEEKLSLIQSERSVCMTQTPPPSFEALEIQPTAANMSYRGNLSPCLSRVRSELPESVSVLSHFMSKNVFNCLLGGCYYKDSDFSSCSGLLIFLRLLRLCVCSVGRFKWPVCFFFFFFYGMDAFLICIWGHTATYFKAQGVTSN